MMKVECFIQLQPTWSRAAATRGELRFITANKLTQNPPTAVYAGAAVVKLVFEVDEQIFIRDRLYPTATIQVDEAVADLKPAVLTAMAKAGW